MRLPTIRERISQLPRSRRYLFLALSLLSILFVFIISIEVFYFFQSGFFREGMIIKGPEVEIWFKGKKTDWVVGTVIEKEGSKFTIENEDKKLELEITGNVFYCGNRLNREESVRCEVTDASEIKKGMFLVADKSKKWSEDPELSSFSESGMFIRLYD